MDFAIEMAQDSRRYGFVHKLGCKDLRDPEPIGSDWRAGVDALGDEWEGYPVQLAPCAHGAPRA
jgi:hypothetical protein